MVLIYFPGRGVESNSDDESVNDNASVYSIRSDNANSLDDESEESALTSNSTEKYEEKLMIALENATEKSALTRTQALQSICEILMHRFLPDFIEDRKLTIVDIIEKSVRRGKGPEQSWGAYLAPLLILQLGGNEDLTKTLSHILLITAQDKTASVDARAKCCSALAVLNFLGGDDIGDVITLMQQMESIFAGSYLKGDQTPSTAGAETGTLHSAALNAWGLLLTLIPPGDLCSIINNSTIPP